MKILVLGNRIPWPLHDGGAIASYAMLRALSGAGIALHFCSFNTKKHFVSQELCNKHFGFCTVKTIPLDSSLSVWGACKNLFLGKSYHISRYERKEANDIVEALLHEQRFDLVLFEGIYSMTMMNAVVRYNKSLSAENQYRGPKKDFKSLSVGIQENATLQFINQNPEKEVNGSEFTQHNKNRSRIHKSTSIKNPEMGRSPLPLVYRSHNVESEIWFRLAQQSRQAFKKWYLLLQSRKLQQFEQKIWCSVDAVISITENDSNVIGKYTQRVKGIAVAQTVYLPGIETINPSICKLQPNKVFHIGSMEWQANQQGVQWFLQKVWPILLAKLPLAEFHLAGKSMRTDDPRFFQSGVINHGPVSDAQIFMKENGIMLVPISVGSGIRIKIIEAMALRVPVVTTSVGVQGLKILHNVHCKIADTPQDFANAIVDLMANPTLTNEIVDEAYAYVKAQHNSNHNTEKLLKFLTGLL
ncbi:MAG: glycosyltransferase [Flavobacteriaceae bacterium]|nr:glycosyltransferase [Flavobacteriaceae bacterium]